VLNTFFAKEKMKEFLLEDIGTGDLTVSSIFREDVKVSGEFIAKAEGILCGIEIPALVYEILGKATFTPFVEDGQKVCKGEVIGLAEGSVSTLLTGERVVLNLMQRMSGIATKTRKAIERLDDSSIKLCDTRKTAPGLRLFDKYAVKTGGGRNHRFGLYDGVMLKDNHLSYAGGLKEAVEKVRYIQGQMVKVEVEVETEEQLLKAIEAEVDIIMLDNRSPQEIFEWRKMIPDEILVEISGEITMENIHKFKGCGAQFLSMGELTHSVIALDISFLDAVGEKKI
jgi:nicotinate-nucleotide pyrophosphorylase (carboxylating)